MLYLEQTERQRRDESLQASRQMVCHLKNSSSRSGEEILGDEEMDSWIWARARRSSSLEGTPINPSSLSQSETNDCSPSNITRNEYAEKVWLSVWFCDSGRKSELMIFRKEKEVGSEQRMQFNHSSALAASNAFSVLGSPN
jgi:hypothetical protein